jgi:hypothetical protein
MKIPKELSVDGNLNTDKTMAKRKRTKVQITIYKTILSIHVERELLPLPEHLSSSPDLCGIHVA